MPVSINRLFLEQTAFDSAAPSGLAAVVHRFAESGQYELTFLRDARAIGRYPLAVLEEPSEEEAPPAQLRIDLAKLRWPAVARPPRFVVGARGHAVFTSSRKEGAYAIVAERAARAGKPEQQGRGKGRAQVPAGPELFDSRRLGPADLFAVTMIRPGRYALANTLTGDEGGIKVAYPKIGDAPYRPPAPLTVRCTARGFSPSSIELQPAQGIVFHFEVPSRIKIDLVEPDDGPGEAAQRVVRQGAPAAAVPRPVVRWRKQVG